MLFVPWSYDIYLNVLKEFANPHFRIFMLLSLMSILSLSGVEAALCRCITNFQLMCRFYLSMNSSTIMPVKEIAELHSLWTVWYRLLWVRENGMWNIVQRQGRSWVHWNTWRFASWANRQWQTIVHIGQRVHSQAWQPAGLSELHCSLLPVWLWGSYFPAWCLSFLIHKMGIILISESENLSVVSDSATPWTIQSMEFSRPEYWSG